jgi:branched-chain amino acid transport system permease protein
VYVFVGYNRVGFPIGPATVASSNFFGRFLQLLVDGAVFGLTLALAAIGLSLIYGTTGLTNFAHGEIVTFGALSTYFFNLVLHIPLVISAILGIIATAAIGGWVQDRVLWRPLRRRGTGLIAMLVVSIGLGMFLRYIYLFRFGGSTKNYGQFAGQAGWTLGPISETPKAIIGGIFAIIAITATVLWLLRSRVGKASRAVSDNPALASASGIDVERVVSTIWILGAGLAGFGGVMLGLTEGVSWNMGLRVLLLVFAAVTLGGLGSAFGAILGALVIGILLDVSTLWIPPELKNVGALVVLIIILLVRPQGILGRRERVG